MYRAFHCPLARGLLAVGLIASGVASAQTFHPTAHPAPDAVQWPTHDGFFEIRNFRFKDGETLDLLRLHYLTLGTPHHNAAGHMDNAILLLHGTGGNAHSLLEPHLLERALRPRRSRSTSRNTSSFFPTTSAMARSSKPSDGLHMRLPGLRLRRHGAQPAHDARRR